MEKSKDLMEKSKDQDRSKGATEQDSENEGGNTSMQGQLGHRDQDADIRMLTLINLGDCRDLGRL